MVASKTFVHYECPKDVFCTLWMSQRHLLYIMNVSKTSFVHYKCLKDIFVCYGCLKDIFCILWMYQRNLLYIMNVSKTSFVCYECIKYTFCMIWMSQRCFLHVVDILKISLVQAHQSIYRYELRAVKTSFIRYSKAIFFIIIKYVSMREFLCYWKIKSHFG